MNGIIEGHGDKKVHRSAFQVALIEFLIIFVCALGWNFLRKTGQSVIDLLGEAAITAGLLYFWERDRKP